MSVAAQPGIVQIGLWLERQKIFILSLPVKSIVLLMQQKYCGPVRLQSELDSKTDEKSSKSTHTDQRTV